MSLRDHFTELLETSVQETGASLGKSAAVVAEYMDQRAQHLAGLVGQPGFEQFAVPAERDNVAMFAGMAAWRAAKAADQRLIGIITGALSLGAKALAGGVA